MPEEVGVKGLKAAPRAVLRPFPLCGSATPGTRNQRSAHPSYPNEYNPCVYTFLRSDEFDAWLAGMRDNAGRARIAQRVRSAEAGNFGDCEPVGEGVSEMRVHTGPGYRLYFMQRGAVLYLLLLGGDKSTQQRDIKSALKMARELKREKQ